MSNDIDLSTHSGASLFWEGHSDTPGDSASSDSLLRCDSRATWHDCTSSASMDQVKRRAGAFSTMTYKDAAAPFTPLGQGLSRTQQMLADLAQADHEYEQLLLAQEAKHRPNPNYIAKRQIELTVQMRSILVDWMIEVSLEYNVSNDTLFLAVSCLDRFLSSQTVTRHQLQLAGTACLFIAAKYEETSPPTIHCFVDITDGTYTKADLLAMEQLVLQRIDYQLTLPTAKTFLRMLLHKCQADRPLYFLSSYIAELSLLEYKLLDAAPSKVAAAAFVWAHMCLQRPLAQHTVKVLSGYSYADLKRTLNQQASLHLAASAIGSSAVHLAVKDKYGSSDFHRVSRLAPANPHMLALL